MNRILKKIWDGIIAIGENAGRSRAAAELYRQGYTKEAKALMLGKELSDVTEG